MSYFGRKMGRRMGGQLVPRSMGACCTSCAAGGPCAGGPHGGLGDVAAGSPAAPDLNTMVADIRSTAQRYADNDLFYRRMQVAATLAIPLAAMITKAIFHWRRGESLL